MLYGGVVPTSPNNCPSPRQHQLIGEAEGRLQMTPTKVLKLLVENRSALAAASSDRLFSRTLCAHARPLGAPAQEQAGMLGGMDAFLANRSELNGNSPSTRHLGTKLRRTLEGALRPCGVNRSTNPHSVQIAEAAKPRTGQSEMFNSLLIRKVFILFLLKIAGARKG